MNYILFFPDELRAETLRCYGNEKIQTPNFDRLAEEGVRFEQCHVQNPVCSPSRCSLFTGQYVHSQGHRTLWNLVKPYEHNLFQYMKDAGYEVRVYGKNDLLAKEAISLSTDVFEDKGTKSAKEKPVVPFGEKGYYDFLYEPMESDEKEHMDYANLKAGIDFIQNRKEEDKPFFLFLPLLFPHCPYTAHEKYYNMYDEKEVDLRPEGSGKPEFHSLIREYRSIEGADLRKIHSVYKGMTSYTDELLGLLMDAVEKAGIADDTVIIASSDHGDYAGDYGLVEKWPSGCEDVLTRVPLIVKGPECKKGHVVQSQVELFDIMATVMDLADIEPQHTFYAQSFREQLHGAQGDLDRAVFCEGGYNLNEPHCNEGIEKESTGFMHKPETIYYPKGLQQKEHPESVGRAVMIRTLTHKLIRRSYDRCELYDLIKDPLELSNEYENKEYSAVRSDLEIKLLDWYLATSDSVPVEEDPR